MSDDKLSLNEIWTRGCKGEPLSSGDRKHFSDMARARFHTFSMSAGHASTSREPADAEEWIGLLVKGLHVELSDNPGLEREWHASDVAGSAHGQLVSQRLSGVH